MYLVMNNDQILASCETHEIAFEFFQAFGGFAVENLHIEKEF